MKEETLMESSWMRTWIDIDLDKLAANYRTACGMTDSLVTCVIKANAYGHGAVRVARCLAEAGCGSFGVSCAREALELRQAGVGGEILVMGATEPPMLDRAVEADLTLTAASLEDVRAIEEAAAGRHRTVNAHIKVNTGFHRLGFEATPENARAIAGLAKGLRWARLTGLFSHLGLIDKARDTRQALILPRDTRQYECLTRFHGWLREAGLDISDVHLCDSIGLVRYPEWHLSRVRVGALLFGARPYHSEHLPFALNETLAFRAAVAQVRDVAAGEIVGYGDDMPLTRDSRIATLCVGYGDGYPRHLSNGKGKAYIRGQMAPVVGLVCMDQMMVDVTDIPGVSVGDAADLLGGGISYDDMARWAGTNRNECLTILSRRPVRVYWQGGRVVTVEDELLRERRDS